MDAITDIKAKLIEKIDNKWCAKNLTLEKEWDSFYNEFLSIDDEIVFLMIYPEICEDLEHFFTQNMSNFVYNLFDVFLIRFEKLRHNFQMIDLALESSYNNCGYGNSSKAARTRYKEAIRDLDYFIGMQKEKIYFLDQRIDRVKFQIQEYGEFVEGNDKGNDDIKNTCAIIDIFNVLNSYIISKPKKYELLFVLTNTQLLTLLIIIKNYLNKLIYRLEELRETVE